MRKKIRHRYHGALTLLFSLVSLCLIFISVLAASLIVYVLFRAGVISDPTQKQFDPGKALLFMFLISNLIGFLVSMTFGRIPMRPVKQLIDGMNQLASGNFGTRLRFHPLLQHHPAFAELSESFNTMAQELENTEVLRTDFINSFSHEFKTPIVSISGFAKLLKQGDLTEKEQAEYLDIIDSESTRLAQMATNVLNLSKVENQTILARTKRYNLSEQLRTCIVLMLDQIEKKDLDLQAEFEECYLEADPEMMRQVWINLVSNAVKFSPYGGSVVFQIREEDQFVTVSVQNSGETIPPEHLDKLFLKFYQVDQSHAMEGNGIGLALVKRVVELHRGEVTVESKNQRITFIVKLPRQQNISS